MLLLVNMNWGNMRGRFVLRRLASCLLSWRLAQMLITEVAKTLGTFEAGQRWKALQNREEERGRVCVRGREKSCIP